MLLISTRRLSAQRSIASMPRHITGVCRRTSYLRSLVLRNALLSAGGLLPATGNAKAVPYDYDSDPNQIESLAPSPVKSRAHCRRKTIRHVPNETVLKVPRDARSAHLAKEH